MKNTNLFRLAFLLFAGLSIFLSSCQPKEEGDKKYVIGFSSVYLRFLARSRIARNAD